MRWVKTYLILLVIITFVKYHQCRRFGGGRSSGRSSSRGGGGYHTSYSRPSYSAPSHPSPSYHQPSYNPAIYNPRPSPPPSHRPPRPNPPAYETVARASTSRSVNSFQSRSSPRPNPSVYESPARVSTSRPINSFSTRKSSRLYQPITTPRPYRPIGGHPPYVGTTPRRYSTARPSLPPLPGRGPVGPPVYNPSLSSGYGGPNKITIKNKYEYHYPGHYSLPVHYSYPGYVYTPNYYSYGTHDTGNTALGFFLGYSLGKLTTPTYAHYSHYDGYTPRYDHYTVHHYYHNRESIPQNQEIRSNAIVGCVGDSTTVCPSNTVSLCTSTGALMCVVTAASTVPCTDNRQVQCVKSTISCVNNTAPECKNSNQNVTTINIPCISNAKVYGDVKYVNNTIITANTTNPAFTNTNLTSENAPNSAPIVTTVNVTSTNSTNNETEHYSTKYPITTTPLPVPPVLNNTQTRKRREVPQDYCVAIVALPAKREVTEGEIFLQDAQHIVEKFVSAAWDL